MNINEFGIWKQLTMKYKTEIESFKASQTRITHSKIAHKIFSRKIRCSKFKTNNNVNIKLINDAFQNIFNADDSSLI